MAADALDRVEKRHASFVEAFAAAAVSRDVPIEKVKPPSPPNISELRAKCGLGQHLSRPLEDKCEDRFSTFSSRRKAGKGALKAAHIWLNKAKVSEAEDVAGAELRQLGRQLKQAHHKRRVKEEQLRKLQCYNALPMHEKEVLVFGAEPRRTPSTYVSGVTLARSRSSLDRQRGSSGQTPWR